MKKQVKNVYRFLAWFFSIVIAAGTLVGCAESKYGPPPASTKYGPSTIIGYRDNIKGNNVD